MGKLLTYNRSFHWTNSLLDRGELIENLSQVIDIGLKEYDTINRTPDLYDPTFPWGEFFEFFWNSSFDHEIFKSKFPWITQSQFQALISISFIIQSPTPLSSSNLNEMKLEFGEDNYSWIGIYTACPERLVFDHASWNKYHSDYVSTFDIQRRREQYAYFKKFYIPKLQVTLNQINQEINNHRVSPIFQAIHTPKVKGEQVHMHFNAGSNCALNLDGSWKHKVQGFTITTQACTELTQWGFLLPVEYYK